jgi:hypothetical protein
MIWCALLRGVKAQLITSGAWSRVFRDSIGGWVCTVGCAYWNWANKYETSLEYTYWPERLGGGSIVSACVGYPLDIYCLRPICADQHVKGTLIWWKIAHCFCNILARVLSTGQGYLRAIGWCRPASGRMALAVDCTDGRFSWVLCRVSAWYMQLKTG